INLARFGRDSTRQQQPTTAHHHDHINTVVRVSAEKSFKAALGETSRKTEEQLLKTDEGGGGARKEMALVKVEPDNDMMLVLETCSIGFLRKGIEIQEIQKKLYMEGFKKSRVFPWGGDMVILRSGEGENWSSIHWWNEFLHSIKPWSPEMVSKKREVWLRVLGVPLHAWGEPLWFEVAKLCGELVCVDEATKDKLRFDALRLKLLTTSNEKISFPFKVEEDCACLQEGALCYKEDQLKWSSDAASMEAGETDGAMVDVDVFEEVDSESDGSESSQHQPGGFLTVLHESTQGIMACCQGTGLAKQSLPLSGTEVESPDIKEKRGKLHVVVEVREGDLSLPREQQKLVSELALQGMEKEGLNHVSWQIKREMEGMRKTLFL
ncbi:DUF4283 domain protein, partial [Trifolium medium]|nr:DUF4283 domain protein [Trifolium medium]